MAVSAACRASAGSISLRWPWPMAFTRWRQAWVFGKPWSSASAAPRAARRSHQMFM